jgi:sugar phosphate isomerase/epimerase
VNLVFQKVSPEICLLILLVMRTYRLFIMFLFTMLCLKSYSQNNLQKGKQAHFDPALGICSSLDNAPLVKKYGFSYIEVGLRALVLPFESDSAYKPVLAEALTSSVPVRVCNSFLPESIKSVGTNVSIPEILAFTDTSFRRAARAGVKIIVFGSGGSRKIPDGFDKNQARSEFIELLKLIGKVAAHYDITLVLEPLNSAETNFINSVKEGASIVREVNHPNIMLLADIYHMMKEGESPDAIVQAGSLIKHVHIAEKESRTAPGVRGDNFRPYFHALKTIGYCGSISIECSWKDMNVDMPLAMRELQKQIGDVNSAK